MSPSHLVLRLSTNYAETLNVFPARFCEDLVRFRLFVFAFPVFVFDFDVDL
jgi:hypothetical protein